ncbi:ADP-ribosylglycohydrolase [uncultured virus]|nr:ADP-ribosylglycohydrolase [uncultured virus]
MQDNYVACIVLHAIGDTIGFKNGEWEFKQGYMEKPLEKLYEFIDLGGINHIPKKNWLVSDDTIMQMKNIEALLENYESMNKLGELLKKKYIEAYNQFYDEGLKTRYPGKTTLDNIQRLINGGKWNDTPYDINFGGSGASMRNPCIGLAFFGEKNRHKLIQISIESSRITHNSTVGYLGGMTSALFTAYAIEGINLTKWPSLLMDLFTSGTIGNYIKKSGRGIDEFINDAHIFINKWKRYIDDKFDENGNPIKRRSTRNLVFRTKYYQDNFGYHKESHFFPGSGGDDSVIIAYDCLLDAENSWEKLVVYSMLHGGDTDTTGCIAGAWWGALYAYMDTPNNILDNLEYRDELINLANELYKKYYKE